VEKPVPAVKAQAPVQVKDGAGAEQVLRALVNSEAERALAESVAAVLVQAAGRGSARVELRSEVQVPEPKRELPAPAEEQARARGREKGAGRAAGLELEAAASEAELEKRGSEAG